MAEGVKISSRLKEDLKIVKKAHEKESWAGIAKMNIDSLDPNSAYKSYRMDKRLSPRGARMTPPMFSDREGHRRQMIQEI